MGNLKHGKKYSALQLWGEKKKKKRRPKEREKIYGKEKEDMKNSSFFLNQVE